MYVQELTQEELKKEHAQVEELREAQSALEKGRSKLAAELKALADKSEKVCYFHEPETFSLSMSTWYREISF